MSRSRAFFSRLWGLFRGRALESEMSDELRSHLDALTQRNVAAGMSPDDARFAALRSFGGVEQVKERARDQRRSAWGEQMWQDLRYALRQLRASPGFTAVVVLSLALGIGANAFFFGLLDRALVRSLPVRNPEALVRFQFMADPKFGSVKDGFYDTTWSVDPGSGKLVGSIFSRATFDVFRERRDLFSDVFAFAPTNRLVLQLEGRTETAFGQFVSGEYYGGLGLDALHGRVLLPDDDRPEAAPVAVISRRLWRRLFAADPGIVGRTVWINHAPVTIVGVVDAEGADPIEAGYLSREITLPLATMRQIELELGARLSAPSAWWLTIMARLRPGVTLEQVAVSLDGVYQQTARDGLNRPDDPLNLRVVPGDRGLVEFRRQNAGALWLPAAFAALVLLAACTNVATLLLARGAARRREIAVRLALGASRGRIVRQLVTESIVLALLGAAVGLLIASWGGLAWMHQTRWHIDGRVLGFTLVAAFVTAVGFSLVPALRATRMDLTAEFQGGVRMGRWWLNRVLIVAQVALSCVLLIAAGLFVRTVHNLRLVNLGFDRTHLLIVWIDAAFAGYKAPQTTELFSRMIERITSLPGVTRATYSSSGQLSGYGVRGFLRRSDVPAGLDNLVRATEVGPDYFTTHGIPIVAGRDFTAADNVASRRVVIISEQTAKRYFGDKDPIGRTTAMQDRPVIVGVVRDAKRGDLRTNPSVAYLPFAQNPLQQATLTIRTEADPGGVMASVRKAISEIDPNLLVTGTVTQEELVESHLRRERAYAQQAGGFGVVALMLACVGLYGFLSYTVVRRTREVGVRLALGALPRQVVGMILREAVALALVGVGVGVFTAAALSRFVGKLMYGLPSTDPTTYGAVALLLVAVGSLAALLPARRAAKVDPMTALRAE